MIDDVAPVATVRSGRSYRIAYPVPDTELRPGNGIMLEFLQFLAGAARRRKHQVLVTGGYGRPLETIADLVRTGSVDGFVLATIVDDDPRAAYLAERHVPFACFGRVDPPLPQHWVDIDNRAAVRQVTGYVLGRGHTDVAYLGYTPQGRWDVEREAGYRDAMTAAGRRPRVVRAPIGSVEANATAAALIGRADRPGAIVAGSDVLAAACYAAAARSGIRVGSDLAVTGFDGGLVSRVLAPALTTVAMPLADIATRLVDRILQEVAGTPPDRGEIVDTILVRGESG
jgi:DNA-binding LacI/PurR family transcriptional regulator